MQAAQPRRAVNSTPSLSLQVQKAAGLCAEQFHSNAVGRSWAPHLSGKPLLPLATQGLSPILCLSQG